METIMSTEKEKPHSAEYFGKQRDFWWNRDFLELMARRWHLGEVSTVLDAGCGVGHWGQLLAPLMAKEAQLIGIDREPKWVAQAEERAKALNLSSRFSYRLGDVNQIDFPDNSFDLVTCQTVLIHVADPKKTLREFFRVIKPGGLIVLAEPNNRVSSLIFSNLDYLKPVDSILDYVRFEIICERGKEALGEGNISAGDLMPGFCSEVGYCDIKVYLSDKASPMIPPYENEDQKVNLSQASDWNQREIVRWDKPTSLRYFLAGGGTREAFDRYWPLALAESTKGMEAVRSHQLHTAGGNLFYLISGRKP